MGIHDQVKDLQIKYPEIEFIGINIDNLIFKMAGCHFATLEIPKEYQSWINLY
jgi:hypothetical protein